MFIYLLYNQEELIMKKIYFILAIAVGVTFSCTTSAQNSKDQFTEFITEINKVKSSDKYYMLDDIVELRKYAERSTAYEIILKENKELQKQNKYTSNRDNVKDLEELMDIIYDISWSFGLYGEELSSETYTDICNYIDDLICKCAKMKSEFMRLPI